MISVSEARRIIDANVSALKPVCLPMGQAAGLKLAEDVHAFSDTPAFPQSSMDGYAFCFSDWDNKKKLRIVGEVAAGTQPDFELAKGTAVRIFTGAVVPNGADTVVMQEKVELVEDELLITDPDIKSGGNVRLKGSEIKAGMLALEEGTVLSPAAIGFLAGIGLNNIKVYPNPAISIIITGNELQRPGEELKFGHVYESNSFALRSALKQLQIDNVRISFVNDRLEEVTSSLKEALDNSDIVLLTGGISVGNYDFVLEASNNNAVDTLFHKVKQRPGKPLFFGKKGERVIFGLPGNPSSVLSCFYQYVIPAIGKLCNRNLSLPLMQAAIAKTYQKNAGLTHFLKGYYNHAGVTILDAQESYRLSSFAKANCLVEIEEDVKSLKEGETVNVHLLPV